MPKYESLHNHTTLSDGTQTHLEVLETAEQLGFGVIAFTDHDLVPTPETVERLRGYQGPVKWLVGTELSSGLPTELGGVERGMVHVLGLFIDPTNPALVEHLQKLETSRVERMKHMVAHLQSIGFKITEDDVRRAAGGSSIIGSPHVVKAIQDHPENLKLEKQLLDKMVTESKTNADIKEKYDKMIEAGPVQNPYRLYMKASSYVPMPRADSYQVLLSLDDSVKLIRQAGGIAVLAHWYFHTKFYNEAKLEQTVKAGLLDGLETATENSTFDGNVDKEVEFLRDLIARYNLIETIGSDSHYVRDFERFTQTPAAAQSVGHTQKIIDRIKPNLEWSNFA